MAPAQESDAKAIWALTWRSILFIPLMLPIAVVWLLVMVSIVVLPLTGAAYLWFGLWKAAALCFVVWAILLGLPTLPVRKDLGMASIVFVNWQRGLA